MDTPLLSNEDRRRIQAEEIERMLARDEYERRKREEMEARQRRRRIKFLVLLVVLASSLSVIKLAVFLVREYGGDLILETGYYTWLKDYKYPVHAKDAKGRKVRRGMRVYSGDKVECVIKASDSVQVVTGSETRTTVVVRVLSKGGALICKGEVLF